MWFFWPDTRGLRLEEVAAIFGDTDEVAIYQAEIDIDKDTGQVVIHRAGKESSREGNVYSQPAGSEDAAEKVCGTFGRFGKAHMAGQGHTREVLKAR